MASGLFEANDRCSTSTRCRRVSFLFISFQTHQTKQDFIQTTKENIKYSEQEIIPWHEEKLNKQQKMVAELESKDFLSDEEEARLEAAPRTISDMQAWLEHAQLQDERSKEMLTAYQEEDWNTYYDYWIYQNQLNKGEIEVRGSEIMTDITSFTYNASITEKELLAKRQFRPVLPSEYVYTIYEEPSHLYEQIKWKKETQRLDSTGLFYLYTFFDWFIYMIPLGLLVFLLGAGFTTEKGKKRTLFLLETQPISKTGIFTGKTVISIMITLGTALGLMVLMILLGTIGNRLGDWMFPVLHYDTPDIVDSLNYAGITNTEGGFHFITMGSYLIETSLLFLATLLFLIVLSLFISLFTESRMNTFVMTGVLAIGGYYLATTSAVSSISPFLPFTYLNIGKIANGEIATVLNNSFIHPWMGIGVLLVSTIILLGIGLVNFQKSGRKNKLSPKN